MTHNTQAKPSVYSGIRWSAAAKYGSQGTQFLVSIILARLLVPEDFGLVGMAMVAVGLAKTLKNVGFNAAIIQRDDVDATLLSTLFWVNLALAIATAVVLVLTSPFVADIYDDNRITAIIIILALPIVVNVFGMIPSSLLQRELSFRTLAIRELTATTITGITSISLAFLDFKVWSLVFGTIAGTISGTVLVNIARPFRPTLTIDTKRLVECTKFGLNILGLNVFTHFARNADSLIIGATLGPIALGFYSIGIRILTMSRESVAGVVCRVLLPKFSREQQSDQQLSITCTRAINGIAFITFPAMALLAVLAPQAVDFALGPKWTSATPLIIALTPAGLAQPLTRVLGQVYLAKGRSNLYFRMGVLSSIIKIVGFGVGAQYNIVAVAVILSGTSIIEFVLNTHACSRLVQGLTVQKLLFITSKHVAASSLCAFVTLCALHVTTALVSSPSGQLAFGTAVFLLCYILLSSQTAPEELRSTRKLFFTETFTNASKA